MSIAATRINIPAAKAGKQTASRRGSRSERFRQFMNRPIALLSWLPSGTDSSEKEEKELRPANFYWTAVFLFLLGIVFGLWGIGLCIGTIQWMFGLYESPHGRLQLIFLPVGIWLLYVSWMVLLDARQAIREARCNRRIAAGLCPACGYDLRATPDRCPECGRETAADGGAGGGGV